MSKVLINRSNLEDIASAIRQKNGRSTHYKPREMAGAIRDIPGGGYPEPTGTVTITQNGTHDVKEYANANVNINDNVFNWKAWRLNVQAWRCSISFISDSEFVLTATDNDAYTLPSPGQKPDVDYRYCYPIASGQKATLTWDYSGSGGTVVIFLENKWGEGNRNIANASTGAVSITANRNTYVNFRFGIDNKGGSGTYSNMRLTIE